MTFRQIVVKNTLVSYSDENTEANKALVFLHGWQSSAQAWSSVIEDLKDQELRLIAMDLPGFGASVLPENPWNVGDYAEMVVEFISKLGLKEVVLIGHSFGGRVAIKVASLHGQSVSKVVLVDSAGIKQENLIDKLKVMAAKTVKPLFALPLIRNYKTRAYRAIGAVDLAESGPLREIFILTINEDLSAFLPQIKAPTLIIWGAEDAETPVAYGEIMNRLIPNSKLVVFNNAGHYSFMDEPDKFSELIKGWV